MRKKLRFADLRSENKVRIRYEPTSADLIDHPTELFRLNSFNVERYWFDFYRKGRWDAHFEYYDPIKRQWVDTGIYGNLDFNRSFETEALGCMSFDEFELKLLDMYDDAMVDIDHRIQKKVDDMVAISQRPAEVPPMGTEY